MSKKARPGGTVQISAKPYTVLEGPGANIRKRPRTIRFAILAHKVLTNQPVRFAPR